MQRQKVLPYVCAPLKVAGLAIGVLNILMTEESNADGKAMAAAAALAQDAAGCLGMALYNLRPHEILKKQGDQGSLLCLSLAINFKSLFRKACSTIRPLPRRGT